MGGGVLGWGPAVGSVAGRRVGGRGRGRPAPIEHALGSPRLDKVWGKICQQHLNNIQDLFTDLYL